MSTIKLEELDTPAHLHGIEVSVSYKAAGECKDFHPPVKSGAYMFKITATFGLTRCMFDFFENVHDGEVWMIEELERTFHLENELAEEVTGRLLENIYALMDADEEILRWAR